MWVGALRRAERGARTVSERTNKDRLVWKEHKEQGLHTAVRGKWTYRIRLLPPRVAASRSARSDLQPARRPRPDGFATDAAADDGDSRKSTLTTIQ